MEDSFLIWKGGETVPAQIVLTAPMIQAIEKSLAKGKGIEIAVKGEKILIWETGSKKIFDGSM